MQRIFYIGFLIFFIACAGTKKTDTESISLDDNQIRKLEENVSSNPNDFQAYFQLAQMIASKGDSIKAIRYLDSALVVRSDYVEARFFKGELLFNSGQLKDAFEQFILVLEQSSSDSYVRKVGGTIGIIYPIRQVSKSSYDQANPAYSPSGDLIIFQSNKNHNWDLFLMNRSGGDLEQLTKSSLNDEAPSFANETEIYFTRQQSANKSQRDIFFYDLSQKRENSVIVHPADDWYSAPSANGNFIFFVSDREINGNKKSKVFRFDHSSKEISPVLFSDLDYSSPWIHPQENGLLFTVKDNGHYSLYQCDFNGNNVQQRSTRNLHFGGPKFSPNGEKVLFFSNINSNLDLFELTLKTNELIRLTGHSQSDLSPNYSPDGNRIVFYSNRTDKYQIYEMNLLQPFSRAQLVDRMRLAIRENKFY